MRKLFLTFFYSGLSPLAPGTCGSIAALLPAYIVLFYLGPTTLFLLSILLFVVAIKPINEYEKETNKHDDKSIVIDEVAGVFLACAISGANIYTFFLSFVFFRVFDITKPSVIGKVDKKCKGGLGVMGDDMLAGLFAGLLSSICHGLYLKLFL